jgi:hypothetical protein
MSKKYLTIVLELDDKNDDIDNDKLITKVTDGIHSYGGYLIPVDFSIHELYIEDE